MGRYTVDAAFAAGGMASVHLGSVSGPMGFSRTVAVKRLLPRLASDPAFTSRFLDEARLAARVRHVNVVSTLDVVAEMGELLIVMEYVASLSLAGVLAHPGVRFGETGAPRIPLPVVSAVMIDVLEGLHAAHTATSESGASLALVHRDVSPQNVLVGEDGVARVIDFGIATATLALPAVEGERLVVGKLGYMAPEQLLGEAVSPAADIYSAAVMLWELLAHRRLMTDREAHVERVLIGDHDGPRKYAPDVPVALESIVMKGLSAAPARRFATAHEMAVALQAACPRATALDVAAWLREVAAATLAQRAADVARFEATPDERLAHVRPSALGLVAYDRTMTMTARHLPVAVPPPSRPRRRSLALLGIAGLLVSTLVLVVAVRLASRSSDGAPAAIEAAPVTREREEEPPAAAAAATSHAETNAASSANAGILAPARTGPRRTGSQALPPSGTPARAPSSSASCRVPFYFDGDGVKQYRKECMR